MNDNLCDIEPMKFETENSYWIAEGTFFQAIVNAPYHILMDLFQVPMDGDGYKTQVEWQLIFEDGEVATIYDWKQHKPAGLNSIWNIGAKSQQIADRVVELIKKEIESKQLV